MREKRRAQVTIFIIIGLVLIAIVALFFVFRGKILPSDYNQPGNIAQDPQGYISSCLNKKIIDGANLIMSHGGFISNKLNITIDREDYIYLCYTDKYYTPCINQEPMLYDRVKRELHSYISDDVENCINEMRGQLEGGGYQVNIADGNFDVVLAPRKIMVLINREITISKASSVQNFKFLRVGVSHSLYDLTGVAQEITSQEAKFCNFEQIGFMLLYNDFGIDKFRLGSGATVYNVVDKRTKQVFKFAVRTCVMPPGF